MKYGSGEKRRQCNARGKSFGRGSKTGGKASLTLTSEARMRKLAANGHKHVGWNHRGTLSRINVPRRTSGFCVSNGDIDAERRVLRANDYYHGQKKRKGTAGRKYYPPGARLWLNPVRVVSVRRSQSARFPPYVIIIHGIIGARKLRSGNKYALSNNFTFGSVPEARSRCPGLGILS